MSKVKELMEKRNDVLTKMTAIIDKAEEEVRAMTETEQQEYDKYKTELKGLNATIQAADVYKRQLYIIRGKKLLSRLQQWIWKELFDRTKLFSYADGTI